MHCEWSIRAVEAGKHVLCEKPMSRHPADVERAFDAAERGGPLLSEAFMYRHHPADRRGSSSSSVTARSASFASSAPRSATGSSTRSNIRLRTDVEGGSLMDVGCYCVSGSRLLAGEPESVFGRPYIGPTGTDWLFTGSLRFADGVLGLFDCATTLLEPRRAGGDRHGRLALPRRPLALPAAGDRATA